RPSFLMVGTIEPRKAHAQVLDAFEQLWREGMDVALVVVGKQGWLVEALARRMRAHPEHGRRLFWLEAISDAYLERVYAVSTCLIAASHGEGFGLPLIESARHGLPIIARDIAVFREVAGECAAYFEGETPDAVARAVGDWLERDVRGERPDVGRLQWLTWEQSADNLMRLLLGDACDGRFAGDLGRLR